MKVHVRPTEERGMLRSTIEDDGAGMDEGTMQKGVVAVLHHTRRCSSWPWVCPPAMHVVSQSQGRILLLSVKKAKALLSRCSCRVVAL
jgi:hypothetical protein